MFVCIQLLDLFLFPVFARALFWESVGSRCCVFSRCCVQSVPQPHRSPSRGQHRSYHGPLLWALLWFPLGTGSHISRQGWDWPAAVSGIISRRKVGRPVRPSCRPAEVWADCCVVQRGGCGRNSTIPPVGVHSLCLLFPLTLLLPLYRTLAV
jgi:hypothetical protein